MLSLLSAGSNAQGQLGNTTIDDSYVFQKCSFSDLPTGTLPPRTTRVLDVTSGANHTLLLLEIQGFGDQQSMAEVWGCGSGRVGQLGPSFHHQVPINLFHKLGLEHVLNELGIKNYSIKLIGATWETSYLVVARPGSHDVILSFGSNDFGDLGVGRDAEDKMVKNRTGIHIVDFSRVSVTGQSINTAKMVNIEKLRTGQRHVIASLKVVWDGREPIQVLIGWGACRHGQLGDVASSSEPPNRLFSTRTSKAKTRKLALPSPPTFCSWPIVLWASVDPLDFIDDFSLGIHHSVFLHGSGHLSVKGSNRKNQIQGLENIQNIRGIKCTWNGTYVLTADVPPRILSTGSNSHGQLGRAENSSDPEVDVIPLAHASIKALACGSEHSLVVLTTDEKGDEVWGWGWNEHGNLGVGNTTDSSTPQRVWPSSNRPDNSRARIHNVWAGSGTSWICYETSDADIESS